MVVLSLCDGISCGQIALDKLNIKVDRYYAAEVKKIAIQVALDNYPNTIEIGDVNKIYYKNGTLYTENGQFYEPKIDLVMFGSPCQDLSIAKYGRQGLEGEKSSLFYKCYQILNEVNPSYWFVENVASMKQEERDKFSEVLRVNPYCINAQSLTGVSRKRYYWTNIPGFKFEAGTAAFQDILDDGYTDRKYGRCITVADCRPLLTKTKMINRYFSVGFTNIVFKNKETYNKIKEFWTDSFKQRRVSAKVVDTFFAEHPVPAFCEDIRYLNQNELERAIGLPHGYTKTLNRNNACNVCGDGWAIPVIEQFFSLLKDKV